MKYIWIVTSNVSGAVLGCFTSFDKAQASVELTWSKSKEPLKILEKSEERWLYNHCDIVQHAVLNTIDHL